MTSSPPSAPTSGAPRRSSRVAGDGSGQHAVRSLNEAAGSRQRASRRRIDAEIVDELGDTADVEQRVAAPELVEVDVLGRNTVHLSLGLGETRERLERPGARDSARATPLRAARGSVVQVRWSPCSSAPWNWTWSAPTPCRSTRSTTSSTASRPSACGRRFDPLRVAARRRSGPPGACRPRARRHSRGRRACVMLAPRRIGRCGRRSCRRRSRRRSRPRRAPRRRSRASR